MANAVKDAQTRAQNQSLVDGSTGWQSSRNSLHDDQDQLVVFLHSGGAEPGHRTGEEFRDVQVYARGGPFDSDSPASKLEDIRSDFEANTGVTISGTTYIEIHALNEASLLEFDEQSRPLLAQTFRFWR